uniref:pyruvate kinase n=1 Tax=Cucumis melo TaxID=3656 RepID=A0A9I9CL66_CUCME
MSVAQFDFSWGSPYYHQETLKNLKMAVKSTKKLCAVMLDTAGPEMLVVTKEDGFVVLTPNQELEAFSELLPINYGGLSKVLKKGDTLFLGQYLFTGSETSVWLEARQFLSKLGDLNQTQIFAKIESVEASAEVKVVVAGEALGFLAVADEEVEEKAGSVLCSGENVFRSFDLLTRRGGPATALSVRKRNHFKYELIRVRLLGIRTQRTSEPPVHGQTPIGFGASIRAASFRSMRD